MTADPYKYEVRVLSPRAKTLYKSARFWVQETANDFAITLVQGAFPGAERVILIDTSVSDADRLLKTYICSEETFVPEGV